MTKFFLKVLSYHDIKPRKKMNIYRHSSNPSIEDGLVIKGYQKKLKTMKRKYFALYKDTLNNAARLEYYDNERKFRSGMPPKRVIKLKNCFNINRRLDTKHDFVIALSTRDGSFGIVLETETEMRRWLDILISLQRDASSAEDSHPQFGHVWQVHFERRGLAEQNGLIGNYFVGLTSTSLTFIRIGAEKTASSEARLASVEFLLNTIRRCGDSQCYFYIEVGRQSVIGPGEFWMQTEDVLTAQNMHSEILSAMSTKSEASMEPMRKRSSSANEASKPINVLQRRQNQTENKIHNSPQTVLGFGRERCDSLPSRNRTSSECNTQNLAATSALSVRTYTMPGLRSHSYQRHSNSPPMNTTIGCSESEESSVSIDEPDDNGSFLAYRFNTRSSKGVIPEENSDDLLGVESKSGSIKENMDNDLKPESVSSVGNTHESYLSMAPVYAFKENSVKSEEPRFASSIMEFPEFIFDKSSKNVIDADSQFERPTRAYSIGSKTEHAAKFNKRPGNLNDFEQNTVRVRAFSVGSRAKIPRCDLQRGALYPKSLIEHSCNSNNNICSLNDPSLPHHLLNTAACSEKKSTSAPILIHKSQNSVDRMSDLMEIDFSKPTVINTTAHRAATSQPVNTNASIRIQAAKSSPAYKSAIFAANNREQSSPFTSMRPDLVSTLPSSMALPVAAAHSLHNRQPNNIEMESQSPKSFNSLIETTTISQTDNGYLEMKPVGDSLSKSSPAKHLKDTNNLYSATNSLLANANATKKVVSSLQTVPENKNMVKPYALQQNVLQTINQKESTAMLPHQQQQQSIMASSENVKATTAATEAKIDLSKSEKQDKPTEKVMRITTPTPTIAAPPTVEYIANRITTGKPAKNLTDQANLNILSARYAQLALDTNINANANINANVNSNLQQRQKLITTENNSSNDDYINIKRKTNEQISAKLKNQLISSSNANLICKPKDGHDREIKLLTHSISDEDNKYDGTARKSVPSNEAGYEILQIKSDSSLQAAHKLHRKDKVQQLTPSRPRSTNSSAALSAAGTGNLSGCTSSSTSCLNYLSTPTAATTAKCETSHGSSPSPTCKVNNASNNPITMVTTVNANITSAANATNTSPLSAAAAAAASRPPSVSSEYELYYASLDLPPSSSDSSVKLNKMDISNGSSPVAEIASANNSYAKIHFDLSDSSSSSSKNVNN